MIHCALALGRPNQPRSKKKAHEAQKVAVHIFAASGTTVIVYEKVGKVKSVAHLLPVLSVMVLLVPFHVAQDVPSGTPAYFAAERLSPISRRSRVGRSQCIATNLKD